MGTTAVWQMVKNCLEDEACEEVRLKGQITLETVQDGMSESERSERMCACTQPKKGSHKAKGEKEPPREPREAGERGACAPQKGPDLFTRPVQKVNPKQDYIQLRNLQP